MKYGLCSKDDFRDNCGFGLIASTKGQDSHELLKTAIQSLTCMTHRGGIAADGKTGDGCGLLLAKPDSFFRYEAERLFGATLPSVYAVGMIFLSQNPKLAQEARDLIEQQLAHSSGSPSRPPCRARRQLRRRGTASGRLRAPLPVPGSSRRGLFPSRALPVAGSFRPGLLPRAMEPGKNQLCTQCGTEFAS